MEESRNLALTTEDPDRAVAFVHEQLVDSDVVHVFGELSFATIGDFETTLVKSVRIGKATVLDLSECSYLDAAAVGVIVRGRRALGDRLRIVSPATGIVAHVLALSQITA
ncbi:MAG: hypothetical protein NVS2B8_21870 [Vulcanimicrobiaceae bacterium]